MDWNETYYFPREILEQADAVKNCVTQLHGDLERIALAYKDMENVHIVGSGDCYFISIAAAEAFKKIAGVEAYGYEAYDYYLNRPAITPKTMVILFSSSGKSLYVLKSAEYAAQAGAVTVSVTNHSETPLGSVCSIQLITKATGVSKSFPTKTTTSALAMLYQMAYEMGKTRKTLSKEEYARLNHELLALIPESIERIFKTEHPKLAQAAQMFLGARAYTFVGSGPCRSAAMVGAAKIVETSREHVTFCNAEEYLHLHGFSVKSSDAVIVIGNNISNHREKQVVEYAQEQCARILVIGGLQLEETDANIVKTADFIQELSPWGAALVSMVLLHLFAGELSKKAGKDPDIPHEVNLKHIIELLYTGPVAGWQV